MSETAHTPYYVSTAGVTICIECSGDRSVLWGDAHPDHPQAAG